MRDEERILGRLRPGRGAGRADLLDRHAGGGPGHRRGAALPQPDRQLARPAPPIRAPSSACRCRTAGRVLGVLTVDRPHRDRPHRVRPRRPVPHRRSPTSSAPGSGSCSSRARTGAPRQDLPSVGARAGPLPRAWWARATACSDVLRLVTRVARSRATVLRPRRERHRQGAHRPRHPRGQPAGRPPLRGAQLRRAARDAHRVGALRPREGGLHRRRRGPPRPLRAGRRRHALPRRGGRALAGGPGQAPAGAPGAAVRADRRPAPGHGGRPARGRHQPGPGGDGPQRRLPARPLPPALGGHGGAAAAARAAGGPRAARRPLPPAAQRGARHPRGAAAARPGGAGRVPAHRQRPPAAQLPGAGGGLLVRRPARAATTSPAPATATPPACWSGSPTSRPPRGRCRAPGPGASDRRRAGRPVGRRPAAPAERRAGRRRAGPGAWRRCAAAAGSRPRRPASSASRCASSATGSASTASRSRSSDRGHGADLLQPLQPAALGHRLRRVQRRPAAAGDPGGRGGQRASSSGALEGRADPGGARPPARRLALGPLPAPPVAGAGHAHRAQRSLRNGYLRFLRGWGHDSNSVEGAVLKAWVESRMGIPPTFHRAPLGPPGGEAWARYARDRMEGSARTSAIFDQLDLVYAFTQRELERRHPGAALAHALARPARRGGARGARAARPGASRWCGSTTSAPSPTTRSGPGSSARRSGRRGWPSRGSSARAGSSGALQGEREALVVGGEMRVRRVLA